MDLSHAFNSRTIYWLMAEKFKLTEVADGTTEGGWHYEANRFRSAEHGGTHLDAPAHFAAGGATVDAVPLARLVAPAVRVDVREACARDRDYAVTPADLAAFEAAHGPIPAGAIVLLDTGFAARWPDRARYLGTAERGAPATAHLHFPGLSADAVRWLAEERRIAAVGIDTASIDPGPSKDFAAHRELPQGVPAFENLASLGELPAKFLGDRSADADRGRERRPPPRDRGHRRLSSSSLRFSGVSGNVGEPRRHLDASRKSSGSRMNASSAPLVSRVPISSSARCSGVLLTLR